MWRILINTLILSLLPLTCLTLCFCTPAPFIYITEFRASPSPISAGGSATLYWNVQGATDVEIDNGVGEVPPYGKLLVKPIQTTRYTIKARNNVRTAQETVTLMVNVRPPIPPETNIPVPTISAQDTRSLIAKIGEKVQVEGNVTYVSSWLPSRFSGQEKSQRWTFLFFMTDIWEGSSATSPIELPGSRGEVNLNASPELTENWRDFTTHFRAIIKPDYLAAFSVFLPAGYLDNSKSATFTTAATGNTLVYSNSPSLQTNVGYVVQKPFTVRLNGVLENYLSAPAIYLTNTDQLRVIHK